MEKTKKLFDDWNDNKKILEFSWKVNKKVQIWEIWVCNIWINIWSEISKDWKFLRPVLIVNNYMWWDLVSIIPITTKFNKNYSSFLLKVKNHYKLWLSKESYFSLNNFKTISKKRLVYKINNTYKLKKYFKLVNKRLIEKLLDSILELNKKITSR